MKIDEDLQKIVTNTVDYSYPLKVEELDLLVTVSSGGGLKFNNQFDSIHTTGFVTNHNNHRIFYQLWLSDKDKPIVFFNHGSAENSSLHAKYVAFLLKKGYNFASFDQEGYGDSDGIRGTVENDDDYVKNFDIIIEKVSSLFENRFKIKPAFYLSGFSAGSPVILEWYMFYTGKETKDKIKKIFLFSPYLKNHKRVMKPVIEFYLGLKDFKKFPLIREDSQWAVINGTEEDYIYINRNISDNKIFLSRRYKDTRIHRINSYKWLSSMIKRQKKIYRFASNKTFNIPVHIFIAQNDIIVDNKRTYKFMKKIKQADNLVIIDGAFHEMLDYEDQRGEILYNKLNECL